MDVIVEIRKKIPSVLKVRDDRQSEQLLEYITNEANLQKDVISIEHRIIDKSDQGSRLVIGLVRQGSVNDVESSKNRVNAKAAQVEDLVNHINAMTDLLDILRPRHTVRGRRFEHDPIEDAIQTVLGVVEHLKPVTEALQNDAETRGLLRHFLERLKTVDDARNV